jgi:hypothetical protein
MDDNNSFLYPQGFHIGAIFYIVKNIGDRNFAFPFNPETYSPQDYDRDLGTFERECRYRIWAMMEMGILEDHRMTDNHLSYQKLTEKGQRIYELMKSVTFPTSFFDRVSNDSWDMKLNPIDYIKFTQTLKDSNPELFNLLHEIIVKMDACQDFISYFLLKGKYKITKDKLYRDYFSNPFVRKTYTKRHLTPPSESYETSRRRISVIIGLLESVNVMSGYDAQVNENVILLESSENVTEQRTEEIEVEAESEVKHISISEVDERLRQLKEKLPTITPTIRTPTQPTPIPAYPRNPSLPSLLKRKRNYTCQVCEIRGFEKPNGILFMSHHHMVAMNRGIELGRNPDEPSNILIVCSWCHDKLEYGSRHVKEEVYLDLLSRGVINQNKIDELRRLNII